jgi:hypothetical protein
MMTQLDKFNGAYKELLRKIDAFIRKYYQSQLIRGILYSIGGLVLFYLLFTTVEYFGRLGSIGRAGLFYAYWIFSGYILIRFIVIPLYHLYRFGNVISHEQAAAIIGKHFPEVSDKLINTLQLQHQLEKQQGNLELILASLDQRISALKPVPFSKAIDFRQNKKYIKYALIPLLAVLLVFFISPSFLADSSIRIMRYSETFEPEAPFSFIVENHKLETPSQQDFDLNIRLDGSSIPVEVFIDIQGTKFRLDKLDKTHYRYGFKNVYNSTTFRLYADGFYSATYELKALPDPVLMNFRVSLDYPAYTGLKDEVLSNTGDLNIPSGTKINWEFSARNTETITMEFADSTYNLLPDSRGVFRNQLKMLRDNRYKLVTANQFLKGRNEVEYSIAVKPDAFPLISVEENQDSVLSSRMYFKGEMSDDYGFSNLFFHIERQNTVESSGTGTQKISVPFTKQYTSSSFFWSQDFSELGLNPGDELTYWFEVWDNDGVSGSKAARTQKQVFKVPTLEELAEQREENNKEMKDRLKESIKDARQIQKELDELNRRILEKRDISWQDKKKLEDLLQQHKQMSKDVENLQKENQLNNTKNEEFKKSDERILEKQKELERLFEQILNEEMKEKMRELERLMENLDKNKLRDMVDQMKLDNKDMEKELDRSLELFKQLEFDQKLTETIEKLDRLKEKQDKLAEDTQKNQEQKKAEQEQLNKEFEELRKNLDELEKKNESLSDPKQMEDTDPTEQDIQQDMQKSSEELSQGKSSKASKSQKSASKKMEQLSQKMKQMQQEMEQEGMEEDIGKLREILENLLQMSFNQEKLMKQLQKTPPGNPLYVSITAEQKKIKDDARMIEDSLFALSKRVVQIQAYVNREISSINLNLDKTVGHLAERQSSAAASRQQYVMTSINNLALMLSEITNQMQQQMASQKQGNGSCSKPGKNSKPGQGKPSMATMRQLQQQLNEQLQKMKDGMNKPGGMNGKQSSEQLARMAAQQEMLRNQIQKLMNEMMKEGNGNSGNLRNIANKMEQTETDLVNRNISPETIRRQQEILTRLLEAEKAEREKGLDEQRESNENKKELTRNISQLNQYNKLVQQETELLKTIPPSLKPFYKNMVKEYFNTIQ